MALSDAQIERYSRQIIVPRVGGRAQERLLASRLLLIGAPDDAEGPLAYLAGAGVGRIHLLPMAGPQAGPPGPAARMRSLNPDAAVALSWNPRETADLVFALLGSEIALEAAREFWRGAPPGPGVLVRLDAPGRIAVLAEPPPCPRCAAAGDLLAPFGRRSENAGAVLMAATTEAFKVLAGYEPKTGPAIIEFDGLKTRCRPVAPGMEPARCGCGRAGATVS